MTSLHSTIKSILKNRTPGQLVIQFTDQCNARCPQCGMRVTAKFSRSTLPNDDIKKMIDAAAAKGVQAVSFTGGEPLLYLDRLVEMIRYAGQAGIPYIRTGTNGFVFKNPQKNGFRAKVYQLAEKLADTPLRNFWISIDSLNPWIHEQMRGFEGVLSGVQKALPILHEHGLYPSANLGLNRNIGGKSTASINPNALGDNAAYLESFYNGFKRALARFYQFVIDLGFTMVNTCYPMSVGESEARQGLNPVYEASAISDIVRFNNGEKALLFKALLETAPKFRSRIRVFSPLCSLYALHRHYTDANIKGGAYPCRGGLDFFFVDAQNGDAYPCGCRGAENLGKYWDLDVASCNLSQACYLCDWECFRDPSELFGPLLEGVRHPFNLMRKFSKNPRYFKLWLSDLHYYNACAFFNSRMAPDYRRLRNFSEGAL